MASEAATASLQSTDRHACPLCRLDDASQIGHEGRWELRACRRCGLAYVYPRPTEDELRTFYNETYYATDDAGQLGYAEYQRHEAGLRLVAAEHLDIMEATVGVGRVLDVGCAYGYFLDTAQERGWDVAGVEISTEAAAYARGHYGIDVFAGTLHDAAAPDASFDAVTMWDCLEHTLDPVAMLREAFRILKPGGCLFVTIPDASTWPARLLGRRWFGYRKAGEHTYFFTRRSMRVALTQVGFLPLEVTKGVWPCDLDFLAEKFAQYSAPISRLARSALRAAGQEHRIVRFPLIDMRVTAQRPVD